MADQTELAFIKTFAKTIAGQPVAFDDDYQAPPHLALKRVPILSIPVPPLPERKGAFPTPAVATVDVTFRSLKPPCAFTLPVQSTDTISDIKSQLASQPRAPPADAQRLLLKGKALADTKLLKEYDVKDGDTINLLVKPGFHWDPAKSMTPFPSSSKDMAPLDTESAMKLSAAHRHSRTPSIVLSPSPSVASLEPEGSARPQDITLTLDTSTIPTASLSPASRSSYQTTISEPAFWSRLLSFLRYRLFSLTHNPLLILARTEFSSEGDALIAFEDFLRASKGGLTANEIAKIRDHVGVVGMAGT